MDIQKNSEDSQMIIAIDILQILSILRIIRKAF